MIRIQFFVNMFNLFHVWMCLLSTCAHVSNQYVHMFVVKMHICVGGQDVNVFVFKMYVQRRFTASLSRREHLKYRKTNCFTLTALKNAYLRPTWSLHTKLSSDY